MKEKEFYQAVTKDMILQKDQILMDEILDQEGWDMPMKNNEIKEINKKRRLHPVAAAFVIGLLGIGSISVGAYALHKWNVGIQERFQVSTEEQAKIEQTDLVQFPDEDSKSDQTSATQNGVTVTATQTIVDNYYAYVALKVEGYEVKPGQTPGFDQIDATLDGKPVSCTSRFYDGTIGDEHGMAVRADGSEVQFDAEGNVIDDYMMKDGTLEYHFLFYPDTMENVEKGGFFGKDLHIELSDLGIVGDNEVLSDVVKGDWTCDIKLSGDQTAKSINTEQVMGDTGAVLTGCEVSPISLRAVFNVENVTISRTEADENIPLLSGVKLKDGTIIAGIADGGTGHFFGDNEYEEVFATNRILDVDQIESVLLFKSYWGDDASPSLDNFYEVPLNK